jgi:hypothetical protein
MLTEPTDILDHLMIDQSSEDLRSLIKLVPKKSPSEWLAKHLVPEEDESRIALLAGAAGESYDQVIDNLSKLVDIRLLDEQISAEDRRDVMMAERGDY